MNAGRDGQRQRFGARQFTRLRWLTRQRFRDLCGFFAGILRNIPFIHQPISSSSAAAAELNLGPALRVGCGPGEYVAVDGREIEMISLQHVRDAVGGRSGRSVTVKPRRLRDKLGMNSDRLSIDQIAAPALQNWKTRPGMASKPYENVS